MKRKGRIYRSTEAGRKALQDLTVPADYRRVLRFIDTEAHADVIRTFLRRYPDELIFEWLGELEELELLSCGPDSAHHDLDFTGSFRLPQMLEEDRRRLSEDSRAARDALRRKGVFIAGDRLANRAPWTKPTGETQILIVEDDPDQLKLAQMRVTMAGYAARTAQCASALQGALAKEGAPDLLLLDIMLPDGDGFDILGKMRTHPNLALLPVVMLTVKDSPAEIEKGLALGADGYMIKPYSKASLADTIRRVLNHGA